MGVCNGCILRTRDRIDVFGGLSGVYNSDILIRCLTKDPTTRVLYGISLGAQSMPVYHYFSDPHCERRLVDG